MKSVLFDMNNLAIRVLFSADVLENDPDDPKNILNYDWNMWKYRIFDSIYLSLWRVKNVSEVVLAVDSSNTWRKKLWPKYKEHRKDARKKTNINWDLYYEQLHTYLGELSQNMPFKIIKASMAEADDIIASICMNVNRPFHIISTDKDFMQLCSSRVKVYNPIKKQEMKHPNPALFVVEQSLIGQAKDNIFNVKTPLDHPEGKRKPGLGPKTVEKIFISGWEKWIKEQKLEDRFELNRTLIDFKRIPKALQKKIVDKYNSIEYPDPGKMYEWIKENNWQGYLDEWTKTENKLYELY